MDSLDFYYRAFKDYRRETLKSNVCEKDRRAIAGANTEQDKLEATKYVVTIEEDWIKAIEDGLKFVEQAVAEERQFIRSNGEVVPIEKIRKISKDSVVHLAKHSDMITHLPEEEGDTIVPDQLYMVEKLSDYAVYENRFLYMMLCYIRNFIEYRLEKIDNLRRSYLGDMSVSKKITAKKRTLRIEMQVFEERSDNPYPIPDENCDKLVRRISDCREIINSLLNTDLMSQVAKSPMIKPPIVKTNVLKMNNNFKNALALYDYIASYKGDGFSYEEIKYNFAPYADWLAEEVAEAANHATFIAYKAGNIRRYGSKLYRCVKDHTSQEDWNPEAAASLWAVTADPAEEWPAWSQPVGAHDAYSAGAKVSHKDKHWTSTVDNNVWEPGVYGWTEATAEE